MLTLNDGRSELWQWDTGRTLAVDADCSQVHFSNKVFGRSIDVDVADGVAIIPDVLLQTDKELNVWAFVGTAENGYTKISKTFKVNRRNKPADYVFTQTDQMTLQTIQSQIGDLADLTTEAKDTLVAAINEAARTGGGAGSMELRVADGYVQYSTDGGSTWQNLIAVADLKGAKGDKGADGKSAYQYAVDGGYTGTEEEFATKLAASGGSGMSSTERSTLIAVVNAIGAFNVANGQELIDAFMDAWVQKIPATGITLSAASLSFTAGTSQALTASVEPPDSTDTVAWSSSNPAVATVANGVVTPVANGDCVITATAGSVSATCTVNVAFAEEVVYYTITNNLTNCTSDNAAASVVEGGSYTATLTADEGYTLDGASVSIVVNGADVTDTAYSGGVVTIQSVTGDVVITAISVEVGATEEVTLLKSITGDGASYIDTGITMADLGADVQIELSAKLASNDDNPVLFGADMWNLYSSYGRVFTNRDTLYCNLNNGTGKNYPRSQDGNGFWNSTAVPNLYSEQRWYKYVVSSDGTLAAIYMDEEMSVIPSSADETMTAFTDYDADTVANSLPIIPIHIFASNVSDSSSNAGKGYDTPGTFTLYYFRIKKHSTGGLLHEYLPAKQGGKIGMYDTVTQTFHANQGTGTFSYEEVSA